MTSWSFLKRGRPAWLTSLPFHESPGIFSFLVAMARSLALTAVVLLALFPWFRMRHAGGFDFSVGEAFFFALVFAAFEDHARWNYVVNATRPFLAATKFAALISILEFLLFYAGSGQEAPFLQFATARIVVTPLHFILSYAAACLARSSQSLMLAVYALCVTAHAAFNVFGVGPWIFGGLDG